MTTTLSRSAALNCGTATSSAATAAIRKVRMAASEGQGGSRFLVLGPGTPCAGRDGSEPRRGGLKGAWGDAPGCFKAAPLGLESSHNFLVPALGQDTRP